MELHPEAEVRTAALRPATTLREGFGGLFRTVVHRFFFKPTLQGLFRTIVHTFVLKNLHLRGCLGLHSVASVLGGFWASRLRGQA